MLHLSINTSGYCYEQWCHLVSLDGNMIQHVPSELCTQELRMIAIKQNAHVIKVINNNSRTLNLILEAIRQDGMLLEYIPYKQQTCEIIQTAVIQNNESIRFADLSKCRIKIDPSEDSNIITIIKDYSHLQK